MFSAIGHGHGYFLRVSVPKCPGTRVTLCNLYIFEYVRKSTLMIYYRSICSEKFTEKVNAEKQEKH